MIRRLPAEDSLYPVAEDSMSSSIPASAFLTKAAALAALASISVVLSREAQKGITPFTNGER
ncbi:MAG: hypothetical protein HY887_07265 [Deltaproteobacteria bacterium]|nr:hypothetical protein [Deltaproteobacteria bacterium]